MRISIVTEENEGIYRDYLPDPFFSASLKLGIVCLEEGSDSPIGFTMLKMEEDDLLIEQIFVEEASRHKGAGSMMLRGACEIARASGLDRVELYYNSLDGKRELPEGFFLANGFLIASEGRIFSFYVSDMFSSDYVKTLRNTKQADDYNCTAIRDLPARKKEMLKEKLHKHDRLSSFAYCREDISFLCEKGDEEMACILCGYDEDNDVMTIMSLVAFSNDPLCVAGLLGFLGNHVASNFDDNVMVVFREAGEYKKRLAVKLLNDEGMLRTAGSVLHGVKLV